MEASPLAPWERELLGLPNVGMTLAVTHLDGSVTEFDNIAIDSARVRRGVLEFEEDDNSTKVKVFYVPEVKFWTTFYR